jgi:ADP-ribose pyrophosphatase YjhB (NUDIX family)
MVQYCPRCGGRLIDSPPTHCGACDYALYLNARPTGGVVILSGDRFLVVRRSREPKLGLWELPGGFCDGWEHPADAAVREAREELGVTIRLGEFLGMYVGSYEFQGELLPVLDCIWLAEIVDGEIVLDPVEASEYAWVPLSDPPPLAFDTMNVAIRDLISRPGMVRLARWTAGHYTVNRKAQPPRLKVEEGP